MKELLTEFFKTILHEKKQPNNTVHVLNISEQKPADAKFSSGGKWYSDENLTQYVGRMRQGKWIPATDTEKKAEKDAADLVAKGIVTRTEPDKVLPKEKKPTDQDPEKIKKFVTRSKQLQHKLLSNITDTVRSYVDQRLTNKSDAKKIENRLNTFTKLWSSFLDAETYSERVHIVTKLTENNFIQTDESGTQIFMGSDLPVLYKSLLGKDGKPTAVLVEMASIIKNNKLPVTLRDNELTYKMNDAMGKLSEHLTSHFLMRPNTTPPRNIIKLLKEYQQLGGDAVNLLKVCSGASEEIRKYYGIPSTSNLNVEVVGALGKKEAEEKEIDKLTDPTDIIVKYTDSSGVKQTKKISLKLYADPSDITIKNLGTKNYGSIQFKDIGGEELDNIARCYNDPTSGKNCDPAKNDLPDDIRKTTFKQNYTEKLYEILNKLSDNDRTQIWKDLVGCNANVDMLVMNSNTKSSKFENITEICDAGKKINVTYENNTISINLEGQTAQFLRLYIKTETGSFPKLMVNLKKRKGT